MTCSNDGSIMIYDILHKYCVACLKPIKMPIDDVLAIDWQEPGDQVVSAHLDAVRIWEFDDEQLNFFKKRPS